MKKLILTTIAASVLVGCGGGSSSPSKTAPKSATPKCEVGQIWNAEEKKCVAVKDREVLPPLPKPPVTKPNPPTGEHCSTNNKYVQREYTHRDSSPRGRFELAGTDTNLVTNNCNDVDYESYRAPTSTESLIAGGYEIQYYAGVKRYQNEIPAEYAGHASIRLKLVTASSVDNVEIWEATTTSNVQIEAPSEAKTLGATHCELGSRMTYRMLIRDNAFVEFRKGKNGGTARIDCVDSAGQSVYDTSGDIRLTNDFEYDMSVSNYNPVVTAVWEQYGALGMRTKFNEAMFLASEKKSN